MLPFVAPWLFVSLLPIPSLSIVFMGSKWQFSKCNYAQKRIKFIPFGILEPVKYEINKEREYGICNQFFFILPVAVS